MTVTRAAPPLSDDATLSALSLTGVDIGTFASDTTAYTADVDHDVETTTVTATATHAGRDGVDRRRAGQHGGEARTVALAGEGSNTITVTVTAEDGVATHDLHGHGDARGAPVVGRRDAERKLSLSGVNIGTFASGTTAYTADVDHDVETTTVTATATHAGATVSIAAGDGNTAGGERGRWRSPRGRTRSR